MMNVFEFAKVTASLCQVIAGDNPSMGRVDYAIRDMQTECQAYYAKCIKKDSMIDCMIARPGYLNTQAEKQTTRN